MAKLKVNRTAQQALVSGLKEAARVGLVSAVGNLLVVLSTGHLDWRAVAVGALAAAYNGASKYVHDHPEITWKGLYSF